MSLPIETYPPSDEVFEAMTAATDSGFSGLPFLPASWPVLNTVWLLLFVAWIGLLLLAAYVIHVSPYHSAREMDQDHVLVLVAWVGLLVLTAYVLRITHGP